MTTRDYADQVRDILAAHVGAGEVEPIVQQLLVIREHDVRELVAYVSALRTCIEFIQNDVEVLGQYVHSVGEWVEQGMTRGQFPTVPR